MAHTVYQDRLFVSGGISDVAGTSAFADVWYRDPVPPQAQVCGSASPMFGVEPKLFPIHHATLLRNTYAA